MINITSSTKIFVACPAKCITGGPELLHQLVYHLRNDLKINAYLYYFPSWIEKPVPSEYRFYNCPFVKEIKDEKGNILVVPEIIEGIKILKNFTNIQKIIWWLSIDNFVLSYINSDSKFKYSFFIFFRILNKIARNTFYKDNIFDINEIILKRFLHNRDLYLKLFKIINIQTVSLNLCQSYYAMNFLKNYGVNKIAYLSDYLNKEFLLQNFEIDSKKDIVAFNPKKGRSFTHKIIAITPDISFKPIENMTQDKVIELLRKAKIYIDFGNHPGRDRLPREAAILGCCVITGKRGAAKYFEDVSIPEEYKFEDKEENIPLIVQKIKECLGKFEEKTKDFDYYRETIRKEPQKFLKDLRKIIKKIK